MSSAPEETSPVDEVARILSLQHGVISRAQAIGAGLAEHDVRRQIRRRAWVLLLPRVYVNHNGEPTWLQRAWAATLFAGDSALCHDSALRSSEGPGKSHRDESIIHVAIDRDRRILSPADWLVVHRIADFEAKVRRNASPPTVRIEQALVDLAAEAATDFTAIGVLTDAVSARRTTADRILSALGVYVELDGRATHGTAQAHDHDLERDLAAITNEKVTVRLGWRQVYGDQCSTATRIATVLAKRGWPGTAESCADCP